MDAPLEAMVYPVKVIFVFFCVWGTAFPAFLWLLSRSSLSGKQLTFLKSFLLHLATLPLLFVWAFFVCEPTTTLSLASSLVVFVLISLYCPLFLLWLLKARFLASLTLGASGGLLAMISLWVITWIWPYPRSPAIVRAPEDMWHLSTDLFDYVQLTETTEEEGLFPLPVDGEGHPIAGSLPESATKTVGTSTPDSSLLFYRGPSFVPDVLTALSPNHTIPFDPFDEVEERPYGYGVGPLNPEAGGVFILSCYGPDGISQAEQLEYLIVEKRKSWNDRQALNLLYSPTNGSSSSGDLIRVEPGW